MPKDVPIKEFRDNLADYANRIEAGESFRVIRRSKPSFIVMHVNGDGENDEQWETIVDCTENGKHPGMPADDLLKLLQKIRRSDG